MVKALPQILLILIHLKKLHELVMSTPMLQFSSKILHQIPRLLLQSEKFISFEPIMNPSPDIFFSKFSGDEQGAGDEQVCFSMFLGYQPCFAIILGPSAASRAFENDEIAQYH